MEGSCSTGQSPPWAVVPVEEEEEEEEEKKKKTKKKKKFLQTNNCMLVVELFYTYGPFQRLFSSGTLLIL
jgi:hypothetical protein